MIKIIITVRGSCRIWVSSLRIKALNRRMGTPLTSNQAPKGS
jgi:hypothetical protein